MKVHDKELEERILHHAAEMMARRGVRGWNMDQLAADVGLAKNTLYKMVRSKEDLVERVVISKIRTVQAKALEIAGDEAVDDLEKLTATFTELIHSVYSEPMREIFLEYPAIEKRVRRHEDEITRKIIAFIQEGIDSGRLRGDLEAGFIFSLFQAMVLYFIKSEEIPLPALGAKLQNAFNCLINGIKR